MDFDLEEEKRRSRTPKSRHRKKHSKTRRRVITMIIAECFALLLIFGYGFVARRWNMIQRLDDWVPEEVQNPEFSVDLPQYQKQKGHWGIYIFGVDSRGSNVSKGTNADVNMICDINHDTGEIKLVSVFRDSYLNINDSGGYNKINQAYFVGGPNAAAKALNKNLDLNITDFVTFNWKAVADGINLLGGVDMEISKAEFYYINSFITETVEATGVYSTHLKQAGMNHLDGVQAVAYGRLRLMDTDFARTERQRKVIQAAFEKAKKADLATLNQLALTVFPQVATSVDLQDIISLLGDMGKYYIGDTGGFPFARGDANMGKKGACVIPQTLESNVSELHEFLYGEENYVPSDTVKKISAKISADTGMYTQGVSIDHVSTSGGAIPSTVKPTESTKAKETDSGSASERTKEEETKADETKNEESREEESREEESRIEESKPESSKAESPTVESRPEESRKPAATEGERGDSHPVEEPTAAQETTVRETTEAVRPGDGTEEPTESGPKPADSPLHETTVAPGPGSSPVSEPTASPVPGSGGNHVISIPNGPGVVE